MKVSIKEIVKEEDWIDIEQGQRVFDVIHPILNRGEHVELSFAGHGMLLTIFLNAAIGQLYNGTLDRRVLQENLTYVDISDIEREKVYRVIANAIRYYANASVYDEIRKEEAGA